MRRSNDDGFVFLPEPLTHNTTTIVAISDQYLCLVIDELLHMLVVMFASGGEYECSQPVMAINGGVEFETIVPTLPVFAKLGYPFGYFVSIGTNRFADG